MRLGRIICLMCAGIGGVQAADETGKWYINPQLGYTWIDDDVDVDDDVHYALGIGNHLNERWSLELNLLGSGFDGPGGLGLDVSTATLDALVVFNRAASVSPYLTFGAGYLYTTLEGVSGVGGVAGHAGAGLLIDVAENGPGTFVFQLRPEAKLRYDWLERDEYGDLLDYLVTVGFAFNFGPPRRSAPAMAAAPAPVPPAPPPPPPAPPAAPPDADRDGILDGVDQCPGTPRGTAVNSVGCPRAGAVTLQGVTFELNSATLTADSRPRLDEVAGDLKQHPRLTVELQGHTDSSGSASYNQQLSQRRAESVRDYLISQGVGAAQLTAKGYGESQPTADNTTDAGREANRRVVMTVTDNPGDVDVKNEP